MAEYHEAGIRNIVQYFVQYILICIANLQEAWQSTAILILMLALHASGFITLLDSARVDDIPRKELQPGGEDIVNGRLLFNLLL